MPARLVVLASGTGTTVQAILDDSQLRPYVQAVGTDRPGVGALDRAHDAGVATFVVPFADYADRSQWNDAFAEALARYQPDLVVLAGFMRIFAADVVRRFTMVNTHPSLLPAYPGVGHRAVRSALADGAAVAGATVHRVDAGVDSGEILAQVVVPVLADDDENSLFARIQAAEKPLYVDVIRQLCKEFE